MEKTWDYDRIQREIIISTYNFLLMFSILKKMTDIYWVPIMCKRFGVWNRGERPDIKIHQGTSFQ